MMWNFCIDLTHVYDQYPIALINESIDEVNMLDGKTKKIEVSKITEYLLKI